MNHTALVLGLAMLSFVMTVIWGSPLLRVLRHFKVGKIIRVEEPDQHRVKMGTPTMGGVLFVLPVAAAAGHCKGRAFVSLDGAGASGRWPAGAQCPADAAAQSDAVSISRYSSSLAMRGLVLWQ